MRNCEIYGNEIIRSAWLPKDACRRPALGIIIAIASVVAVEALCKGCEAISPMLQGIDTIKKGSKVLYDATISAVDDVASIPRLSITNPVLSVGIF